jgi:hypothetical protein
MRATLHGILMFIGLVLVLVAGVVLTPTSGQNQSPPRGDAASRDLKSQLDELERKRAEIEAKLKSLEKPPADGSTPTAKLDPRGVAAVSLDKFGLTTRVLPSNVNVGWEFEVKETLTVTDLGMFDGDGKGLDSDFPIAIYDAPSGKLIVSSVVPAGEKAEMVDQFRYVKIKPIELDKGHRYVIAAFYRVESKENPLQNAPFATPPPIRWLKSKHMKADKLELPKDPMPPLVHEFPGSFGPNFRVADGEVLQGVRTYYRSTQVPQQPKYQVAVLPEAEDGSHREDKPLTVALYASPNGKVRQILFGDKPLGAGAEAYTRLAEEVRQVHAINPITPPMMRVSAMGAVPAAELQRVMSIVERRNYNSGESGRVTSGVPSVAFSSTGERQPEREGKFIVPDRFVDHGEYVEDHWTGLLWQKDGIESEGQNFFEARDYAAQANLGGIEGWRLPTADELASIFPATFEPFTHTQYNPNPCCGGPKPFHSYWTGETDPLNAEQAMLYHWYHKGGGVNAIANANSAYVRCVHDPLEDSSDDETQR